VLVENSLMQWGFQFVNCVLADFTPSRIRRRVPSAWQVLTVKSGVNHANHVWRVIIANEEVRKTPVFNALADLTKKTKAKQRAKNVCLVNTEEAPPGLHAKTVCLVNTEETMIKIPKSVSIVHLALQTSMKAKPFVFHVAWGK
jgi:hypothetical protein